MNKEFAYESEPVLQDKAIFYANSLKIDKFIDTNGRLEKL